VILTFKQVITPIEHKAMVELANRGKFVDGMETAGRSLSDMKRNTQLSKTSPELQEIAKILITALQRHPLFMDAVYPHHLHSVLVSRYTPGMAYGKHVDAPIMGSQVRYRTDLSLTLFLNEPTDYEGGELSIESGAAAQTWKLNARDLVCYPTSQLHEVCEITRGERLVVVGWVQSFVRDDRAREVLWDLARAKTALWNEQGRSDSFSLVKKAHANLLRRWTET
jgi:PKHD-type hydroxylase